MTDDLAMSRKPGCRIVGVQGIVVARCLGLVGQHGPGERPEGRGGHVNLVGHQLSSLLMISQVHSDVATTSFPRWKVFNVTR